MENPLERTVRSYLKDKAPGLYAELVNSGELDHFLYYTAAAISNQVDEQRRRGRWDFLPHQEFVARVSEARSLATESTLAGLTRLSLVQ
jgi:hypothetical protein